MTFSKEKESDTKRTALAEIIHQFKIIDSKCEVEFEPCKQCKGQGKVKKVECYYVHVMTEMANCPICDGIGHVKKGSQ
jgi:DnaJ-class molecular chaperone